MGRGTTLCSISSGTGLNSRFTVVVPTELGGGEALECVDLEDIEPLWLEHMDGEGEIRLMLEAIGPQVMLLRSTMIRSHWQIESD